MRLAPALLALAVPWLAPATPAVAQPPFGDLELRAQQEAAARRAIDQANQTQALEYRLQTEQAVSQLKTPAPALPALRYAPTPAADPAPVPDVAYPSIPDRALAESNRRVQAVTKRR